MGISCASEIFTEEIRLMLADLPGQVNMIDDILVFGRDEAEHQKNLLAVLERLESRGITLNKGKCQFYRKELTFFGLRFTADGVSPTEDRCRALREAQTPKDAKELRSFLCSALYSARFMQNHCIVADPLWRLCKAGVEWKWGPEEQNSFDEVKNAISTKCMGYFNKEWRTEVIVDASKVGLGAVFVQHNPNDPKDRRIISFASRMLSEIELHGDIIIQVYMWR